MVRSRIDSIGRFLSNQVLRDDYWIINEPSSSTDPHSHLCKLQRVDYLCRHHGYRPASDCDRLLIDLTTMLVAEKISYAASTVILINAYLPQCITSVSPEDTDSLSPTLAEHWIVSDLDTGNQRYRVCLPPEFHALLIDHAGALLAA